MNTDRRVKRFPFSIRIFLLLLLLFFLTQNAYVNINRIMSVATRLSEAGHYASQQIKQISAQLDQEWKSFAAALDERSTILAMSAVFHQKAEQVGAWPCVRGGGSASVIKPAHHTTTAVRITMCAALMNDNVLLITSWPCQHILNLTPSKSGSILIGVPSFMQLKSALKLIPTIQFVIVVLL